MPRDINHKSVLIVRKTRLQELVERFNTWPQAKFYLEHNQVDATDYLVEHDRYQQQVVQAEQYLSGLGPLQKLERTLLPEYAFQSTDMIIVIGQDGLVANTMKYLDGQRVIAINPDPGRWDGRLLPFTVEDLPEIMKTMFQGEPTTKEITFAEAKTNDGQKLLAVNDLFIGPQSHQSARYRIHWHSKVEVQSSSGIIVSTGFGSTGWLQSVLAGAVGVTGSEQQPLQRGFSWQEQRLQFSVREPFPSKTTGTEIVFGEITPQKKLAIESLMPERGVIFSDGLEDDYLSFTSGTHVNIGVSSKKGLLVVNQKAAGISAGTARRSG